MICHGIQAFLLLRDHTSAGSFRAVPPLIDRLFNNLKLKIFTRFHGLKLLKISHLISVRA